MIGVTYKRKGSPTKDLNAHVYQTLGNDDDILSICKLSV